MNTADRGGVCDLVLVSRTRSAEEKFCSAGPADASIEGRTEPGRGRVVDARFGAKVVGGFNQQMRLPAASIASSSLSRLPTSIPIRSRKLISFAPSTADV